MSSLWEVPAYLVMAFSLALDAPAEKTGVAALLPPSLHVLESADAVAASPLLPDEAWLRAVKAASPHSDVLARYGGRIFVTSSGRDYVPVAGERAEILALQKTRAIATRVLAAATVEFKAELARATGREPTRAALLIAHLYGTSSAISYLRALEGSPQRPAIAAVPQLANAWGPASREPLVALDARVSAELGANDAAKPAGKPRMVGTLTRPDPVTTRSGNKVAGR